MRLLPLVLSVHANGPSGGDKGSCPFCGVHIAEGREPNSSCDEEADGACPRCHLVRHLERETIAEEAVLIWFPELSQAAVNALVGVAHRRLARDGALYLAASPFSTPSAQTNDALEAIRALEMRSAEVEGRLGASSPRVLGDALMRAKPKLYADRAKRLGGVRLLSRGKFFVGGEDIYPRLIAGPVVT
jgi:intracellular multiplication protein IcmJ